MKLPNEFKYYINAGTIIRSSRNPQRAAFLVDESDNSFEALKERIEKLGIDNKNANSIIKDCYDIVMELIRAKLLLDGYSSSGLYAHEAEISYLRELNFLEKDIGFLNELRYFRNSITYYGKILDKNYAEKVFKFLNEIYPRLKSLASKTQK